MCDEYFFILFSVIKLSTLVWLLWMNINVIDNTCMRMFKLSQ